MQIKWLKNRFIVLSFLVFSVISVLLLLKFNRLIDAFDMQFHFRRIMEWRTSIAHDHFFPNYSFNNFNGSAVMTAYPYFNLFPIVFLSFLIKSKIVLVYLFYVFNTFMTLVISYFSCRSYVKANSTSYIFAIIYSLSNVLLAYNFLNMDLGVVSSFEFLPLAIFGFMNILKGRNKWLELSFGMSLLAFSHLLSLAVTCGFLFIWLIVNVYYWNRKLFEQILKSFFSCIILTSIFWLSFIHLYITNLNNIQLPFLFKLTRIHFWDILSGLYERVNYVNNIGLYPVVAIVIAAFYFKRFNRIDKQVYLLSVLIMIGIILFPSGITSIGIFKLLNQIQGMYRFLIIPIILLSYIFSLVITQYIQSSQLRSAIYVLIALVTMVLQLRGQHTLIANNINHPSISTYLKQNKGKVDILSAQKYNVENNKQFNHLVDATSDEYDYTPIEASHVHADINNNQGLINQRHKTVFKHSGYNTFSFSTNQKVSSLALPIYVYHGEKLNILLNGHYVHAVNQNGQLVLNHINNQYVHSNNKVKIIPNIDWYRMIGVIISILSLLFALGLIFINNFA